MVYYKISGFSKRYSLFYRDTKAHFPFITQLFRNKSWKTEAGIHNFVKKNMPDWEHETIEEYRERKELLK